MKGDVLKYRKLSTNPAAKIPAAEFTPHTPLRGWWLVAGGKPEVGAGGGGEEKEDGCCAIQSKTSTSPLGSGGN